MLKHDYLIDYKKSLQGLKINHKFIDLEPIEIFEQWQKLLKTKIEYHNRQVLRIQKLMEKHPNEHNYLMSKYHYLRYKKNKSLLRITQSSTYRAKILECIKLIW